MLTPLGILMLFMNDINDNNNSIIILTLGYLNPTCVKTFYMELYIFKKRLFVINLYLISILSVARQMYLKCY
jgi:hypothetical protein